MRHAVHDDGIGASFLRGKIRHTYESRTSYYRFQDPITAEVTILDPPYELFDDIIPINTSGQTGPAVNFITQVENLDSFIDENRSTSGIALDTELSVGYRVHKWVEIYLGFRGSSFDNVGIDSRRTITQVGSNLVERISTNETSASYEGFFGGVRFHY